MKRFSDFATERSLDGAKKKLEDILDQEIEILAVTFKGSKFERNNGSNECMTLQVEIDSERCVIFTGSTVLIDQARKYQNQLPFVTTIKKIDRYYTFT